MENSDIFKELDSSFTSIDQKPDSFCWQSSDIVVQWDWEIPVPVSLPGSIISFSFSTQYGDIAFGVQFISIDNDVEDILAVNRVPSNLEPITGSFKIPREGRSVFVD